MNPKVFEGFTDPEGGEWIRFKSVVYKDVCWRPHDMEMTEQDQLTYKIEFLDGPGFVVPKEGDTHFEKVCGQVLIDMLAEAAAQTVAEDDKPQIVTPSNDIILP